MSGHFPPASDLDRPGHATLKGWLFDEVLTSFSRSSWDIVPWTPMTASPHTCDGQGAHHWTWFFFRGLNRQICVATRCLCKSSAANRCRKLEASKSNDRRRHWGSRRQPPIQGPGTCRRVSGAGDVTTLSHTQSCRLPVNVTSLGQVRKATIFLLLPIAHCVSPSGHATLSRPVWRVRRRVLFPICVYVQANTFPMPCAMVRYVYDGACQAASPTEDRRPHYTDEKMPRCFL